MHFWLFRNGENELFDNEFNTSWYDKYIRYIWAL